MPSLHSTFRRWLFPLAKLVVVAVLIWGVHRTLWDGYQQLREQPLEISSGWLAASAALYLLGTLPACLFWWRVLRVLGQPVALGRTIRAYYIGHLGKYVPGKALVVVLRAGLVGGPGVDATIAGAAVFIETLTMMASGSFIAAALIGILHHEHWQYVAGAVLCMLGAGLPTLPPVFMRLLRLTKFGRGATAIDGDNRPATIDFHRLDYRTLLFGWIATGLGWFITGLSLWATSRGIRATTLGAIESLPQMTMVTCVAVVAGFMSMIPGGLGVRDAVLAQLIKPLLGARAAISAVVLRLVWLAAELVISASLFLFVRRRDSA